jgi:metal-responsive CopG/Arc/MetJ family transcriptional regulator
MGSSANISVTRTQVCLAPKLVEALDRHAERQMRSRSCLIREAIMQFLREKEKEDSKEQTTPAL